MRQGVLFPSVITTLYPMVLRWTVCEEMKRQEGTQSPAWNPSRQTKFHSLWNLHGRERLCSPCAPPRRRWSGWRWASDSAAPESPPGRCSRSVLGRTPATQTRQCRRPVFSMGRLPSWVDYPAPGLCYIWVDYPGRLPGLCSKVCVLYR